MKKSNFSKLTRIAWVMLMALAVITTSCKKDDEEPETPPVVVLDGVYVKGAGTALTDFDSKGKMTIAKNEVTQEDRASLMELYVAVKAGAEGFNIITVEGSVQKVWGPGSDFAMVAEADLDGEEPQSGLWRGSLEETATPFTVDEDGLYHVAFDSEAGVVVMAKVDWGIIGGATPGGWGENTVMEAPAFDLNTMTYTIPSVTLTEDTWKFRYSNGWKIILDAEFDFGGADKGLKVNTNLGGSVDALSAGGDNIANAAYANYTVTLTWTLGEAYTASAVFESDAEPLPEYPEAMYLVGAGTAYGWDAPGTHEDALMHKVAGGGESEGLFWKICHLEAGQGFKVSAENWGTPNLGFAEVDEFDADGFGVNDIDGNMDVELSGMYMIVLDLRNDMTKLSVASTKVYGIGDAFGSWDEDVEANLFLVNDAEKTVVSPATSADGNIRMYAEHAWIPAWWNAEFNVFSGVIEYRNDGGDQDPVATTAGQVATLLFDDNTGTIQ